MRARDELESPQLFIEIVAHVHGCVLRKTLFSQSKETNQPTNQSNTRSNPVVVKIDECSLTVSYEMSQLRIHLLTWNNCTPMTEKINKNRTVMMRILRTFFSEYTMHWNTAYRGTKSLLVLVDNNFDKNIQIPLERGRVAFTTDYSKPTK